MIASLISHLPFANRLVAFLSRPKRDPRTPRRFLYEQVQWGLRHPFKTIQPTVPLHMRPIDLPPKDPLPQPLAEMNLFSARLRYRERLLIGLVRAS